MSLRLQEVPHAPKIANAAFEHDKIVRKQNENKNQSFSLPGIESKNRNPKEKKRHMQKLPHYHLCNITIK